MLLLDTDILIDCLRGVPAARTWLKSAATEAFGIPGIVAMELLIGCRNQPEQQRVQKFLAAYPLLWPDASEFARAYELLAAHRLATGVGIPDCVIAAMALTRQTTTLYFQSQTFSNLRRLRCARALSAG